MPIFPPLVSRIRHCLPALLLLTLSGCHSVFFGGLNALSSSKGIQAHRDIVFDPQQDLALDVYSPKGATQASVVVYFHGGTWQRGQRQYYRWVGQSLARRGVVAVLPDYRKFPDTTVDGFMRDSALATAWAFRHAGEYGGDPQRLVLMGHSAGAHIVSLLATDSRWLQAEGMRPLQLCGMIGLAGAYDFLPSTDARLQQLFGSTPEEHRLSLPMTFADGDEPPILLLHGSADRTVPARESLVLQEALQRAGSPVTLKLYPGVGHSRINLALIRLNDGRSPTLADSLDFIRSCKPRQIDGDARP